jgi:hypothetical protein
VQGGRSETMDYSNIIKEEEINNAYNLPSTKQSIRFLHAAAGFLVKSTWMHAIKAGNYVTWPRLTHKIVPKHFPESNEVQKGPMKQQGQNVGSTKIKIEPDDEAVLDLGNHDDEPIPDLRTHADTSNNTANPDTVKKTATKDTKNQKHLQKHH